MIHDIPSPDDYYKSGKELLDLAWDIAVKQLITFTEHQEIIAGLEDSSEEYWEAAKRHLTTSLSTTQQGVEFILKGKIAEISPFLLIGDPPQKWPSPYKKEDLFFSDFRSIDAQDLIKVYDSFSASPLDENFKKKFNELRTNRNKIMHSVDKRLVLHITDVIDSILYVHNQLFPLESWCRVRLDFLSSSPESILYGTDFDTNTICHEIDTVIKMLNLPKYYSTFRLTKDKGDSFVQIAMRQQIVI